MFRVILVATVLFASASAFTVPIPDGRIIGGSDAYIEEFPHQISMRYFGRHRCGGSVYSKNIIVSASHCVVDVDVTQMTIVAGSTFRDAYHIELPVTKIIMHPNYTAANDYDVAILVLGGFLQFDHTIQPIALAKERPEDGSSVTVTGWGTQVEGSSDIPNQLQKVDVNLVSNTSCNRRYLFSITDRMICAAVTGGGKDACQGDSGGPLVYNNTLLGIVSWGIGCARSTFPGVYASVPYLHDWIVKTASEHTIEFA